MPDRSDFSKILELTARWYVFAMIWIYGLGKIAGGQFYRHGHLPEALANKTVADLSAFELAWTFFGYSNAYILFIGFAQLLGGILLLWDRTKILGVAILTPILANIILVDLVYEIGAATNSAIFYFSLLLLILYFNKEKVIAALQALTRKKTVEQSNLRQKTIQILAVAGLFICVFFLETVLLKQH